MNRSMKQWAGALLLGALLLTPLAMAEDTTPHNDGVSGRSVLAGVLSFLIWPGIGQAVNNQPGEKALSHVVV